MHLFLNSLLNTTPQEQQENTDNSSSKLNVTNEDLDITDDVDAEPQIKKQKLLDSSLEVSFTLDEDNNIPSTPPISSSQSLKSSSQTTSSQISSSQRIRMRRSGSSSGTLSRSNSTSIGSAASRLDAPTREKCAELAAKLHVINKQQKLPEEVVTFVSQQHTELEEVLTLFDAAHLNDEVIFPFCNEIIVPEMSFQRNLILVRTILLPKIASLTQAASRVLFNSVLNCSKKHPKSIVYGLLLPLVVDEQFASAQCEILNRILKELSPEMTQVFLRGLLMVNSYNDGIDDQTIVEDENQDFVHLFTSFMEFQMRKGSQKSEKLLKWNELIINILTVILGLKLKLTPHITSLLVVQLQEYSEEFSKSLKYSTLIFNLISKFGQLVVPHAETLKQILSKCEGYMTKPALTKLAALANSS